MRGVTSAVSAMLGQIVAELTAVGIDPDGERVYLLHFADRTTMPATIWVGAGA
jgi:hypothetical protein